MVLLYGKCFLQLQFLRKCNLAGCILHLQFLTQFITCGILLCQFLRMSRPGIDIGPDCISICQPLPLTGLHRKITHSQKSPEIIRGGRRNDAFSQAWVSVHHHLPGRQNPGSASFLHRIHPLSYGFRVECAAVLKIIQNSRKRQTSVFSNLTVSYTAFKSIAHKSNTPFRIFPYDTIFEAGSTIKKSLRS